MEREKVESSDDFEEALIPQVRNLGKDIIRAWAAEEEKTYDSYAIDLLE